MNHSDELIILAHYVNVRGLNDKRAQFAVREYMARLLQSQQKSNFYVKHLVFPIKDRDSYVECVYPTNISDPVSIDLIKKIEESDELILNSFKDRTLTTNDTVDNKELIVVSKFFIVYSLFF